MHQGVLEAPGEGRASKAKTTAMITAVAGAVYAVAFYTGHPIPIPQDVAIGIGMSLLGLGQYFIRRAIL
jgi:hypothetical protein